MTTAFNGRSSRRVAVDSFSFTLASSIAPVSRSLLFIKELKPSLNVQSDSLKAKLF